MSDLARAPDVAAVVAAHEATLSPRTRTEYGKALRYLGRHLGTGDSVAEVAASLLGRPPGEIHALLCGWVRAQLDAGAATATVQMRLAAVSSLGKLACRLGVIAAPILTPTVRVEPREDRTGCTLAEYEAVLRAAAPDPQACAILRLMGDRGLRRQEVADLDVEHLTPTGLLVRAKGRREREPLALARVTAEALARHLEAAARQAGPMFVGPSGDRITGDHVHQLVGRLGRRAGVRTLRPHGLRHFAITRALTVMRGDMRAVSAFARHRNPATTARYDDRNADRARAVAEAVAGASDAPTA